MEKLYILIMILLSLSACLFMGNETVNQTETISNFTNITQPINQSNETFIQKNQTNETLNETQDIINETEVYPVNNTENNNTTDRQQHPIPIKIKPSIYPLFSFKGMDVFIEEITYKIDKKELVIILKIENNKRLADSLYLDKNIVVEIDGTKHNVRLNYDYLIGQYPRTISVILENVEKPQHKLSITLSYYIKTSQQSRLVYEGKVSLDLEG